MSRALKVLYEIRDGLAEHMGGERANKLVEDINRMIEYHEELLFQRHRNRRYQ